MKRPDEADAVPRMCRMMFEYLEHHAGAEAIFRKPGRRDEIETLIDKMDSGEIDAGGLAPHVRNPHVVAHALTQYFRSHPTSIGGDAMRFASIAETYESEHVALVRQHLPDVGPSKLWLLRDLFRLLVHVHARREENKMGSHALCCVWSVNIFRPKTSDLELLIDLNPKINKIMEMMILRFDEVFAKDEASGASDQPHQQSVGAGMKAPTVLGFNSILEKMVRRRLMVRQLRPFRDWRSRTNQSTEGL